MYDWIEREKVFQYDDNPEINNPFDPRQRRMDGAVAMKTFVHGSKCAACLPVVFDAIEITINCLE